jgi:hypothetical protein
MLINLVRNATKPLEACLQRKQRAGLFLECPPGVVISWRLLESSGPDHRSNGGLAESEQCIRTVLYNETFRQRYTWSSVRSLKRTAALSNSRTVPMSAVAECGSFFRDQWDKAP